MVAESTSPKRLGLNLLDSLWRVLEDAATRETLLVLLSVSLLLGSLFPQLPRELADDPAAAERWLSSTSTQYGVWTAFVRATGLLDIGNSVWFRLTLAVAGLHLLLSIASLVASSWSAQMGRRPAEPSRAAQGEVAAALSPPMGTALDRTSSVLTSHGLVIRATSAVDATSAEAHLYADRQWLGLVGHLSASLGGLVLLLGLFVNSIWGWQTVQLELTPGQELALGHGSDLRVRLERSPSAEGTALVAFLPGQEDAIYDSLSWSRPARHRGIVLYQIGDGPALRVAADSADGQPLTLQAGQLSARSSVSLRFEEPQAERQVTLPRENLVLRVVAQATSVSPPPDDVTFTVQAFRGGSSEPVSTVYVRQRSTLQLEGARLTFEPERFAIARAAHMPGNLLLVVGSILGFLGVLIALSCPTLRVWAELLPERRAVAVRLTVSSLGFVRTADDELESLLASLGGNDAS